MKSNISPFPFYTNKEDRKKWYAYGRDYKYLAPQKYILPFQINRAHREEYIKGTQIGAEFIGGYLKSDGTLVEGQSTTGVLQIDIEDVQGGKVIYVENMPRAPFYEVLTQKVQGASIAFVGTSGSVISTYNPMQISERQWSGVVSIPSGTQTIYVTSYNESVSTDNAVVYNTSAQTASIKAFLVRDSQTDTILFEVPANALKIVNKGNRDYIISLGLEEVSELSGKKRMYIELTDGVEVWYSADFGWCTPCLKIEWYDGEDFVVGNNEAIIYSNGYKNEFYVDAEIGMPSYEYEEEVAERGGHTFPIMQVSYKQYQFSFLAPEEVCDMLRIVRMSDYIRIYAEDTYEVANFLMTPTWQEQGYLAEVVCEFATASVAKKTGKGYTINKSI